MAGFGDVEGEGAEGLGEDLPGPEEGAAGDAGVDDVAAVVAGVVPAAVAGRFAGLAGGGVVLAVEMAGAMLVAVAEIDGAAAALAVVGAQGEAEGGRVDVVADGKTVAGGAVDLEPVEAGGAKGGEVRLADGVAGGCVGERRGELAGEGDLARGVGADAEGGRGGRRGDQRGELGAVRLETKLIEEDAAQDRRSRRGRRRGLRVGGNGPGAEGRSTRRAEEFEQRSSLHGFPPGFMIPSAAS